MTNATKVQDARKTTEEVLELVKVATGIAEEVGKVATPILTYIKEGQEQKRKRDEKALKEKQEAEEKERQEKEKARLEKEDKELISWIRWIFFIMFICLEILWFVISSFPDDFINLIGIFRLLRFILMLNTKIVTQRILLLGQIVILLFCSIFHGIVHWYRKPLRALLDQQVNNTLFVKDKHI